MKRLLLPIGSVHGRLTVISERFDVKSQERDRPAYLCRCICGQVLTVLQENLRSSHTQSCGCLQRESTAGVNSTHRAKLHHPRLYYTWHNMKARCATPSATMFKHYGGKGLSVCPEWRDSFETFRDWAFANGYDHEIRGLSLDRIDCSLGYSPDNCRWVPFHRQARNKTVTVRLTAFGETKSAYDWADDPRCTLKPKTIIARVRDYGWPHEAALTYPLNARKPKNRT